MEIFSLPLSNFSKYLRKESHYLLHVDYLHSEKEKKEKKLVYNSSINCPKSVKLYCIQRLIMFTDFHFNPLFTSNKLLPKAIMLDIDKDYYAMFNFLIF